MNASREWGRSAEGLLVLLLIHTIPTSALPHAVVSAPDTGRGHFEAGGVAARTENGDSAPWVTVVVSPLVNTNPRRQLELSWAHAQPLPGDWVGLFEEDPRDPSRANGSVSQSEALSWTLTREPEGNWLTGVGAARDADAVTQCAAYVTAEGRVMSAECARMRPAWMAELAAELAPLRLREILLPGTHDSGAYKTYAYGVPETLVTKYTITQEENILTQLRLGVRYLDIRVGYYPHTSERWWLNHGVARIHPLDNAIEDVHQFIMENPMEIIIFDVQHFPVGFGEDLTVHRELVSYLMYRFDALLIPRAGLGWSSTVGAVWSQRGRVVLGYDHDPILSALPDAPLWPAAKHLWADANTLAGLRDFLHSHLGPGAPTKTQATAAMAELTPTAWDVILDKLGGLRRMADAVNLEMTSWLRDEWAPRANAFAVDFVRGTDVVRVAVDFNFHRGRSILARRGTSPVQSPAA